MSDKKAADNRAKALAEVRRRLTAACATEDGLFMLRYIAALCGQWTSSIVVGTDSEAKVTSTLVNEARRSVYLDLTRMVRADIVKKAEAKRMEKTNGSSGKSKQSNASGK